MIVGQSITGYPDDWVEQLDQEDRDGMRQMGRMAIEGLAEWLHRDPVRDARIAQVRERLERAGQPANQPEQLCKECGEAPAEEWGMCGSCIHDAERSGWVPGGGD